MGFEPMDRDNRMYSNVKNGHMKSFNVRFLPKQ